MEPLLARCDLQSAGGDHADLLLAARGYRLGGVQTGKDQWSPFIVHGVIEHPVLLSDQQHLRWPRFKTLDDGQEMYEVASDQVFRFLRREVGFEEERR